MPTVCKFVVNKYLERISWVQTKNKSGNRVVHKIIIIFKRNVHIIEKSRTFIHTVFSGLLWFDIRVFSTAVL